MIRPYIQSIDSTSAFKCGFFNLKYPIEKRYDPKRPLNYFLIKNLDKKQRWDIIHNLTYINKICQLKK